MPIPSEYSLVPTVRFLVLGLFLLGLAWFTPLTVDQQGHFFVARAAASPWSHVGDWAATWCSFKIILLGLGGFLLVISLIEFLVAWGRDTLALLCGLLVLLPIFTFFLGCYYLVKAIL